MAADSPDDGVATRNATFSDDEVSSILDYFCNHRNWAISQFLKSEGLKSSGNKEELRKHLQDALDDKRLTPGRLVDHLNSIEGWGNQHIYLYKSPPGEIAAWKTEAGAKQRLAAINKAHLLNVHRPLLLPARPTLSSVEWSPSRVRLLWIEGRDWELRRPDLDSTEDAVMFKAFEEKVARGITSFDWNLDTGEAALMIQRLPTGERYDEIRQRYEAAIEDAIHVSNFQRRNVRKAIAALEAAAEVQRRHVAIETQRGAKITFTSATRREDAFADPDLKNSRRALGQTASVLGNFYWIAAPPRLERSIHVKLYATDQRVGIFGECTETEVLYVLSRIIHHSR